MFGLFSKSKNTIKSPTVLLASIGSEDSLLIRADRDIYDGYFPNVETISANTVEGFYDEIGSRTCDILHLLARVSADRTIQSESGASFFGHLLPLNVKILILASENDGDNLVPFCPQAATAGLDRVNMVMTLERKGDVFGRFIKSLFGLMMRGRTMPQAWVELAPQNPNMVHDSPETVFSAGYGSLKLSA